MRNYIYKTEKLKEIQKISERRGSINPSEIKMKKEHLSGDRNIIEGVEEFLVECFYFLCQVRGQLISV